MSPVRFRAAAVTRNVVGVLFLVLLISCSTFRGASEEAAAFVVEGAVTVRGNEPFTDLFLETEDRNSYVLAFEEGERAGMQRVTPGRFRVTGRLYRGDWNGKPYAFVAVESWVKL